MDDKEAAKILIKALDKYKFTNQEKEALRSAIGVLGWTALAQSRIKARKDKFDKLAI